MSKSKFYVGTFVRHHDSVEVYKIAKIVSHDHALLVTAERRRYRLLPFDELTIVPAKKVVEVKVWRTYDVL